MRGSKTRRYQVDFCALEARDLLATAVSSLTVTPSILNPPNQRYVQVQVRGTVIESSAKVTPSAAYQVSDEYRRIEPGGSVKLTKIGTGAYAFSFRITLQAKSSTQFAAGRRYYVVVGAQDHQNGAGLTVPVWVPAHPLAKVETQSSSTVHMTVRTRGKSG